MFYHKGNREKYYTHSFPHLLFFCLFFFWGKVSHNRHDPFLVQQNIRAANYVKVISSSPSPRPQHRVIYSVMLGLNELSNYCTKVKKKKQQETKTPDSVKLVLESTILYSWTRGRLSLCLLSCRGSISKVVLFFLNKALVWCTDHVPIQTLGLNSIT